MPTALLIASPVDAQHTTFDEALAAYEASSQLLRSFDVSVEVSEETRLLRTPDWSKLEPVLGGRLTKPKMTVKAVPVPERSSRITQSRQRFQNGMFLLECLEADGRRFEPGENLSSWNHETYKSISSVERAVLLMPYARTQVERVNTAYQNLFLVFDGDYSLVDFIRDRPNRYVREEGEYVILTAEGDRSLQGVRASRFGLRLQLDPNRGFMPVKVTYLLQDSDVPQSEWTNELYEPIDGLWVPHKSVMKIFYRKGNTPYHGQIATVKTVSIDVAQSSFNAPVERSVFSPEIPPGYEANDGRLIVR